MRYALIVIVALLAACGTIGGPPDFSSLTQNDKTKNAGFSCLNWNGTGGTLVWAQVNQEAGVIKDGGVSLNAQGCVITTESKAPPKAPAAK